MDSRLELRPLQKHYKGVGMPQIRFALFRLRSEATGGQVRGFAVSGLCLVA